MYVGKIEFPHDLIPFDDPNKRNLVQEVSCKVCTYTACVILYNICICCMYYTRMVVYMLYLPSSIPHVMYTMYARYVIYAPSEKKLCTISVYLLSYLSHYIYIYI